jgi:hypothetical protein
VSWQGGPSFNETHSFQWMMPLFALNIDGYAKAVVRANNPAKDPLDLYVSMSTPHP